MRKGSVCFILTVFFILQSSFAFSDSGLSVKDAVFLPKVFYVGDKVELRVTLQPDKGKVIKLPEQLPSSDWLTYDDITLKRGKGIVALRIVFTPYAPGTRTLPSLKLGDTLLDSVKIHTASVLENGAVAFKGIKKPLLIPGTKLLLGFIIALLFVGPVFVLGFAGSIKKKIHRAAASRRGKRPKKQLFKVLKGLEEERERMSSRQFYFKLSDAYRKYLSLRTGIDFMTTTSTDFGRNLDKVIKDKKIVRSAASMVIFSDSIKFGGVTVSSSRKEHDLHIVKDSVLVIEQTIEESVRGKSVK